MRNEHFRLRLLLFILVFCMIGQYTAAQYIQDVQTGDQVACKWVKLAVQRHLNDLKRSEAKDPEFPYYYDEKTARRVIDFKQELRHT